MCPYCNHPACDVTCPKAMKAEENELKQFPFVNYPEFKSSDDYDFMHPSPDVPVIPF